jgi:manganese transport protein
MYKEPFDIKDNHSRIGVLISLIGALILIFFIKDPFKGLIWSQVFLSVQLPFTVAIQVYLTSSVKVMGKYANTRYMQFLLWTITSLVTYFNIRLLLSLLGI